MLQLQEEKPITIGNLHRMEECTKVQGLQQDQVQVIRDHLPDLQHRVETHHLGHRHNLQQDHQTITTNHLPNRQTITVDHQQDRIRLRQGVWAEEEDKIIQIKNLLIWKK